MRKCQKLRFSTNYRFSKMYCLEYCYCLITIIIISVLIVIIIIYHHYYHYYHPKDRIILLLLLVLIWIQQNKVDLFTLLCMSCINKIHYFKVLYGCLGAVENTHLIKLNLLLLQMHIDRKKVYRYFKFLKHYVKALYSNAKAL